jgi:prepilin peptidase CpaA
MLHNLLPSPEVQIQAVLVALLAYVIVDDLRNFRVRNDVILAIGALAIVYFTMQWDWRFFASHLMVGGILFAVFSFLYARGWMGGGDVKLLVAAFVWLGQEKAQIFVVALTVFATVYGTAAKFLLVPAQQLPSGRAKVPYAPSIALAWIAAIVFPAF